MEKNEEKKSIVLTVSKSILFIYSAEINTKRLIEIQNAIIDECGSRKKFSEKDVDFLYIEDVINKKTYLPGIYRAEKDDKIVLISKKQIGYRDISAESLSISEPVYDIEYELIKMSYMAKIIERILNDDFSAILDLNPKTSSENETEINYARKIVSCIRFQEIYSCSANQYLEVLDFTEKSKNKKTRESASYLKKLMIEGNQIIDKFNNFNVNSFQMTYESEGGKNDN